MHTAVPCSVSQCCMHAPKHSWHACTSNVGLQAHQNSKMAAALGWQVPLDAELIAKTPQERCSVSRAQGSFVLLFGNLSRTVPKNPPYLSTR